jgi:hypothetical protein
MSSKRGGKAGGQHKEDPPLPNNPPQTDHDHGANPGGRPSKLCGWHLLALVPIILAFIVYHLPTIYDEYMIRMGYGDIPQFDVPQSVMNLFRMYDNNADGSIDPYEFLGVIQDQNISLVDTGNGTLARDMYQFVDAELGPGKEGLTLMIDFTPLKINTMSKFTSKDQFLFGSPVQLLPGLVKWTTPNHPIHTFGVGNFKTFLPPYGKGVGDPYYIVDSEHTGRQPHMNAYYPPPPRGNEVLLHALVSMFHPNVFINCRFGPRGTLAVLRAENDKYYDVIIRSHVEFQLNSEPAYPFWFTPAQFAGRLIISKDVTHVEFFELAVPNKNALNVGM